MWKHVINYKNKSKHSVAQTVKHLPTTRETQVWSLGQEDPLEKELATTPVLLPGKSHGWRSVVGYSPWGHKELDTTERLHSLHSLTRTHREGNGEKTWPQTCTWTISNRPPLDTKHRVTPSKKQSFTFWFLLVCSVLIWKWKSLSRIGSFRPHGLYSSWNSPGQNTGVG